MSLARALFAAGLVLSAEACRASKPTASESSKGVPAPPGSEPKLSASPGIHSGAHSKHAAPSPPGPEPLKANGEPFQGLAVEGFGDAVLSVPLGAVGPRPIVVALHGNYDRPEWQCSVWREVTQGFPWVLCPRGVPRHDAPRSADRWTFAGLAPFEKELHAALAALQEAYPRHVDPEHPVFAGFSLGAILGVHLLKKADSPFERAVLIEGGYKGWGVAGARAFARRGGKKLLLGCGQTACVHAGKQVKRLFGEGPTGVEVVSGGNVGHTYDGEVARAVREHWGWLVQGDARFSPPRSNESP